MSKNNVNSRETAQTEAVGKAFLGFFLSFFLILLLPNYCHIVISETDSQSSHYFLHLPRWRPQLNDFVLLYSKWYGKKIIKQIAGMAGDKIWYDERGCLRVNNKKIGFLKSSSKDNRILTPIQPQVIPAGFVFVFSEHPHSFDSRYQELGLVPLSMLEGRVIPLR